MAATIFLARTVAGPATAPLTLPVGSKAGLDRAEYPWAPAATGWSPQLRQSTFSLGRLRDIAIAVGLAGRTDEWLWTSTIVEIMADHAVSIPGVKLGESVDDFDVRLSAAKQVGRMLTRCFKAASDSASYASPSDTHWTRDVDLGTLEKVQIDGQVIIRARKIDNSRNQAWTYRFVKGACA